MEIWRDVVGYEGLYQVSSLGRVKSLERYVLHKKSDPRYGYRHRKEKILVAFERNQVGHLAVNLYKDESMSTIHVHVLVLEAFVGKCPSGEQCRHLNDIKSNNQLDNLCWGTPKENSEDSYRNGRSKRGGACKHATITDDEVLEIVEKINKGNKLKALSNDYGVTLHVIKDISSGKSFNWLTGRRQ